MSNKQSSVEWLIEQVINNNGVNKSTFQQAKEMHKEELKKCAETFEVCYYDGIHNGTTFNEYYNETYGGNNEQ